MCQNRATCAVSSISMFTLTLVRSQGIVCPHLNEILRQQNANFSKEKKTCKAYLCFEWVFVKDSLWLFREASF